MIQTEQPDCFLCGSLMHEELCGLSDNRFGSGGEYRIAKCLNCGLLRTLPVPEAEELKQLYEKYYNFERNILDTDFPSTICRIYGARRGRRRFTQIINKFRDFGIKEFRD